MTMDRYWAAGATFNGTNLWMISGGSGIVGLENSTEIYDVVNGRFYPYVDMPVKLKGHNMVNVNNTHMVVLGGDEQTDQVYLYDRLVFNLK